MSLISLSRTTDMKINLRRFAWIIFVFLYTLIFFYNCLNPYPVWGITYIYTMSIIAWLAFEYYNKRLFFQSGFIPYKLYRWYLRVPVALFFYSSFIIGLSTIIWWHRFKIHLFPFIQIAGILILLYSIYLRTRSFKTTIPESKISNFYLSVALFAVSLALGYGSWFLIIYTLVIGFPLIFWQYSDEKKIIKAYQVFIQNKKVDKKDYEKLWNDFIARRGKNKSNR